MLNIIPVPAFNDNYLWVIRNEHYAAVVDPGDAQPVEAYLQSENLTLCAILITHHHKDHTGGVAALCATRPALPVFGPARDPVEHLTRPLAQDDTVSLPELELQLSVLDVPGHTLGHIAYFAPSMLFCGDTLFAGGCGRVFEGDAAMMLASLDRLAALPDDTRVYCAHEYTLSNLKFAKTVDPGNVALAARHVRAEHLRAQNAPTVPTLLGVEKTTNPFLRCRVRELQLAASRLAGRPIEAPVEVFATLREAKNQF